MDVVAAGKPCGTSSKLAIFTVRAEEMRAMRKAQERRILTDADSKKLAGCVGWPVSCLLDLIAESMDGEALDAESVGFFVAADGLRTEPISLADLRRGVLLHSNPDGSALTAGGALRLWFPAGAAVQQALVALGVAAEEHARVRHEEGRP